VYKPVTGEMAVAQTPRSPTPAALTTDGPRYETVYVEDNPSNLAFMRELMDDLPKIELITAPNAELGIELIRAHLPGVVIMDVNLPGKRHKTVDLESMFRTSRLCGMRANMIEQKPGSSRASRRDRADAGARSA
jgi:hypothetical protein